MGKSTIFMVIFNSYMDLYGSLPKGNWFMRPRKKEQIRMNQNESNWKSSISRDHLSLVKLFPDAKPDWFRVLGVKQNGAMAETIFDVCWLVVQ